ncbi:MAG: hypothetical protein LBL84_01730 [Candidatus Nomurabacteria bacterium]|jgi:hypothetical protein|nr:hypothetical protein [Candidatus Nomurabacteria bacterium]
MVDPRRFILNTDYPMDMIIGLWQGQAIVGGALAPASVPHGLPFAPLIGGVWSLSADFGVVNDLAAFGYQPGGKSMAVFSDSTNLMIQGLDGTDFSSTFTAFYQLYAFAPAGDDSDLPATATSGNKFVFNSDRNYMKLAMADFVDMTSGSPVSITHGLGFLPSVDVWAEFTDSTIVPMSNDELGDANNTNVGTTQVTFSPYFSTTLKGYHYRIYADEIGASI